MLKLRVAYLLLMVLLSKEITGSPHFGFDLFGAYDDENDENKDTNLMEKNGKIFSDWFSSIFDYFYDDTDDSDDADDKYLICKNCTVIVGESQSHNSTQATSSTTQATSTMTTNGQNLSSSTNTTQATDPSDGPAPAGGQP